MIPFINTKYLRQVLALLIIVVAVFALYFTFSPAVCADYGCFEKRMAECKPTIFINEEVEASWKYEIKGTAEKACKIEVTLLGAKEGEIGLRNYEGDSMTCLYDLGSSGLPEKNLATCHGTLKEGLQSIVIEKLYKYVIDNLGEIRDELLF